MNSILDTIKQMLGILSEDTSFDVDIIVNINSAFMVLCQIGVGPTTGFSISDKTKVWSDFIGTIENIESIKTLIYMKVKLVFDPPPNSFAISSYEKQIDELTWRLMDQVDPPYVEPVEV